MRVADTPALYAAFVAGDGHHEQAHDRLGISEVTIVPSEILSETLALLQLRHGFEFARSAGSYLRELPHVRIEGATSGTVNAAWRHYEEAGGTLSLPDAFVVAWCLREGASAFTFDRAILKRVGGA